LPEPEQLPRLAETCLRQSPHIGFVKCNLNATLFREDSKVGMIICLRNEKGNFIPTMIAKNETQMPPLEVEAWSLHQGVFNGSLAWAITK
jgi:hypothetical protein